MNINKFIIGGAIIIMLSLIGFLTKSNIDNNKLYKEIVLKDLELSELKLKHLEELNEIQINVQKEIDNLVSTSQIKFDSLLYLNSKLKYRKYEKPIYIDRNLDDALLVLSKYRYDKDTTEINK